MTSLEEDDSDIEDLAFQDFYSCPVCMDRYSLTDTQKTPIILLCHHSLCKACLNLLFEQSKGEHAEHFRYTYLHNPHSYIISCPVCRKQLQIREGEYPVNFYITKFLEEHKKKRDVGPNLALWCKDCKSVAKEVCRLHSTQKLGDALCSLATSHKYLSSTLLEVVSTYIESSKMAYSNSDSSIKKLENSMSEMRNFTSKLKTFLKVLRNKKQDIHTSFHNCRNIIASSVEKTKTCEPFACNSDDLVQDAQTWLQPSIKVDDDILRDRARVVCQGTQIKLVKTLEENIKNLKDQEVEIAMWKELEDDFNKEQANINFDFFKIRCERLVDNFRQAFSDCFKEVNKLKDQYDLPNERGVPFGKSKIDKPKVLAKELESSLNYFIELMQAEKGTGSGTNYTPAQSQSCSSCTLHLDNERQSPFFTMARPSAEQNQTDSRVNSMLDVLKYENGHNKSGDFAMKNVRAANNIAEIIENKKWEMTTVEEQENLDNSCVNLPQPDFDESRRRLKHVISRCAENLNNEALIEGSGPPDFENLLDRRETIEKTPHPTILRLKLLSEVAGDDSACDRIKRPHKSSTNKIRAHKRRIIKKRTCGYDPAEILNICSDSE